MEKNEVSSRKLSRKLLIILGVVVVAILIVSLGTMIVLAQINNKPEKVLADALVNTFTASLESKPSTAATKIVINSDTANVRATIDLDTKSINELNEVVAKVKLETAAIQVDVSATAIMVGQNEYYFKVDNLEESVKAATQAYITKTGGSISSKDFAEGIQHFDPLIKKVNGRWIKVTNDDIDLLTASKNSASSCSVAVDQLEISKEDQKKLRDLFLQHKPIVVDEVFAKESVIGEKSYHYLISNSSPDAVKFIENASTLESFNQVINECDIDIDEWKQSAQRAAGATSGEERRIELWVSTGARRVIKLLVVNKSMEMTVNFTTQVKYDAKDVQISVPQDTIGIEEIKNDIEKLWSDSGV